MDVWHIYTPPPSDAPPFSATPCQAPATAGPAQIRWSAAPHRRPDRVHALRTCARFRISL